MTIFLTQLMLPFSCSAQIDEPSAMTDSGNSATVESSEAPINEGFPPEMQPRDDDEQNPDTALDTDLPLAIVLSAFRWGHLSLLSLTADEGYNSNPNFKRLPSGSYLTSLNGLLVDSETLAGWQLHFQYRPFIWISSQSTIKSFAAASFDIRKFQRISSHWHWTAVDQLRYAPSHATEQQEGFVAAGGFSVGNAFLSSGRNILMNGAGATLTDSYGENSSLLFHANQDFTRLSSYIGTSSTIPVQDAISASSGVTWRDHYSFSNTLSLGYNYRVQTSTARTIADVQTHTASIGWSHKLLPTLGVSATAGPTWSMYGGHQHHPGRMNVHGSLALSKEFRRGGAVVSVARSDGFTGIISNSFHNRFEFAVHREVTTRLRCSASASYIQQQVLNSRNTDGKLLSTEARYYLSRNWSFFGQVRYLKISGDRRNMAPENNAVIGFRWAWTPENP